MSEPSDVDDQGQLDQHLLLNRSDSLPQIGVVAVMASMVATTTQV